MTIYPGVRTGTVDANGTAVTYYDSAPNGYEGPAVVLLHGTAGNAESNFWALYPMVAMTRRAVTLDFALPPEDIELTLDHYVDEVVAVIRATSPSRPIALVGHSLGAVVGAAVAARHPELVESLVLVAGWIKTDRHQLLRNTVWQWLAAQQSPVLAEFNVFNNYSHQYLTGRTEADFQALLQRTRQRVHSPRVMALNRVVDISDEVEAIEAPTLVIGCAWDQSVVLQRSRELFGAIVDSRFAVVDSGHSVVQERPAELYFLIEPFIADPKASAAGQVLAYEPI
jgi:pimeloyl-ACP methyl ester carboxylesterase